MMSTRVVEVDGIVDKTGRRRRIAKGSGTSVQEVNQLLSQFKQMQKVMKVAGKPVVKMPVRGSGS